MVVVAGNGDMYEIFFGSSYGGDEQEAQNQEIYDWEVSHYYNRKIYSNISTHARESS